jgi:hypothetical protein
MAAVLTGSLEQYFEPFSLLNNLFFTISNFLFIAAAAAFFLTPLEGPAETTHCLRRRQQKQKK